MAVARALVTNPRVLFADEPTGALDSLNGERVMELLTEAARSTNAAVVLVTHEARVAAYSDREIVVRDGKSRDMEARRMSTRSGRLPAHEAVPARARAGTRGSFRDLAMGVRFAVTGGREGWVRLLLTAVGVGLGWPCCSSPPHCRTRSRCGGDREEARLDHTYSQTAMPKADNTLVIADIDTTYREKDVRGRLMEPEGARAPLPPGVDRFPAVGEMVVSPALKELLTSGGGKLLRERLPYRIVGTIGESGLIGSAELAYYAGADGLATKIDGSSVARNRPLRQSNPTTERSDPVLVLLSLVVFVVSDRRWPCSSRRPCGSAVSGATAGSPQLRLIGSDGAMTRRIAAGEALAGALLGLVLGAGFFLVGRQAAGSAVVLDVSVFPSYLNPSPLLAVLVAVAVPAAAVLVTLFALRGVVIEPLGVVRTARPARRRLWWRLLLPLAGLAMLYPMIGKGRTHGDFNQYLVTGGVVLLLVGITACFPGGRDGRRTARPGRCRLATRRAQAPAEQRHGGPHGQRHRGGGGRRDRAADAVRRGRERLHQAVAERSLAGPDAGEPAERSGGRRGCREVRHQPGVRKTTALSGTGIGERSKDPTTSSDLSIGDCAALRELATLPCATTVTCSCCGAPNTTPTRRSSSHPAGSSTSIPPTEASTAARWPGPCRRN